MITTNDKTHWYHSDSFGAGKYELIKSFTHKNYSIGLHTHSFYELNIVLKGNGKHFIDQMSCNAKPGCVFVIPPYVKHGYQNYDNLDVYHMLIHRDFFDICFNEFSKSIGFSLLFEIEPFLRAQYHDNMFLILSKTELDNVLQDIDIITECDSLNEADIFVNAIAKKMLAYLCMLITKRQVVQKIDLRAKEELINITDCLNYIHQNFDRKLSVKLLAENQNMSRSTFIRQFTKICKCSPHQYLMQYRLKKANEYLNSSDKSITEISQLCGFYDASHLRRCLNSEK